MKEKLKDKIRILFYEKHGQMAGSPTITTDLYDEQEYRTVHRSREFALMNEMGFICKIQRKFTVTTNSKHNKTIAENYLSRNFFPKESHKVIAGDITYICVASHWMYLSVFINLYSRKVVGWDLSKSLNADSTCLTLKKYLNAIGVIKGLMVHSDCGEQFWNILKSIKATQSMSKGDCFDNAVIESFFHALKTRLIYHRRYKSEYELKRNLFWYIEIHYNSVRKHSANKLMTPEQKEDYFYKLKIAA